MIHPLIRSPVLGSRWVVITGHRLASLAGNEALEKGGTVIDAMVAASAALTVLLPHATSLGGDSFLLYFEARTGRLHGLNASGVAPRAAEQRQFPQGIPVRGPRSALVPGLVRGWGAAHARFGRLPLRDLLRPALHLATHGHPASRVLGDHLGKLATDVAKDAGCAGLFLRSGKPVREGQTLVQPALAETLSKLSSGGCDAFYRGEIARTLSRYCLDNGGLLTEEDLSAFSVAWVEPIGLRYRDHEVYVMPPNSYGVLLLLQLAATEQAPSDELTVDDASRIALQVRSLRCAFKMAFDQVGDPREKGLNAASLFSAEGVLKLRACMEEDSAGGLYPTGGTSCVVVADARGNAASLVQSVYNPLGSMFLEPSTGILLNNRLSGFSTEPGRPNSVGPGKRPAHTLCPVMVLRDRRPRWVLASPGGVSQTAIGAQMVFDLLRRKQSIAEAVHSPRWSIDRAGELLLEADLLDGVAKLLESRGYEPRSAESSYHFGSVKIAEIGSGGGLKGFADQRREAYAIAR